MNPARGFTLIELLSVVVLTAILALIVAPAARRGIDSAREAACSSNLRQMHAAFQMYMDDHNNQFFPWRERLPDGWLWYWGFEPSGGTMSEGRRKLDRSRARLAPYLGKGTVETCPAFPYNSPLVKKKFEVASYGYGINVYMLSDTPDAKSAGVLRFDAVNRPSEKLVWGDAAQVNMFQSPASTEHPLLEEWYYLAARHPAPELPTFHFRHRGRFNGIYGDGRVASFQPDELLSYCDNQVGYLEPRGRNSLLHTSK